MDLGVWGFTAYVFADLGSETMALSASWLPTISELAGRGAVLRLWISIIV